MAQEPLDLLLSRLAPLRSLGVDCRVVAMTDHLRIRLESPDQCGGTRFMLINHVDRLDGALGGPLFMVFGGRYGRPVLHENVEGRRLGSLDFVATITESWLLGTTVDWNDLPIEGSGRAR